MAAKILPRAASSRIHAADWSPAFSKGRPEATDPETERYLLFSAIVGLLEQASARLPAVVVLDDLHWADKPTLELFRHVVAETHGLPLLLLATYRDSDLSRDHPLVDLLADLRREEGIERLLLRGLEESEVAEIMETAAGKELGSAGHALAREITAETDGNPFFVGEILRHLAESGALAQDEAGRWEVRARLDRLGLPQSVREVIGRRVERLGEECSAALSCAAVIGRDFDLELLARTLRTDEDALMDLLEAATASALLQEHAGRSGSFSFAHNLINHTLYDALGPTRRARLHRQVAEALEDLCRDDPGARIAELAHHWTAATAPVDVRKAVAYSKQAGERALAKVAPDEAVRWFTHALELLDKSPGADRIERCELTICLGEAQRQAGRPEFRATLLDATRMAEQLGDADRMARAALANNRGFASVFGVVDGERVAALERAIAMDRSSNPARSARLLALQAMELQFDPDHGRRRALADKALSLARQAEEIRILPYVLRDHFHATWSADTLDARRRTAAEMMELAEVVDDPLARFWALDRMVHAAAEAGELADARDLSTQLLALTQDLGTPGLRWHATYYAAGLAELSGDLDKADRLAAAAARLGEQAGEPDTVVVHFAQISAIRSNQGRGAEIVGVLEQATAANPGIPGFEAGLAAVLCELDRDEEAAPLLERAAGRGFADIPVDQVYSTALALWARTTADLRSAPAAAPLYDLIEPWRGALVWTGAVGYGSAESYLGMLAATLGAHDRAAEHFGAASAVHERAGVKGWEAQNLCYWARSLLEAGATQEARAKAEQALALARDHGFGASARLAAGVLELAPTA